MSFGRGDLYIDILGLIPFIWFFKPEGWFVVFVFGVARSGHFSVAWSPVTSGHDFFVLDAQQVIWRGESQAFPSTFDFTVLDAIPVTVVVVEFNWKVRAFV